MEERKTDRLFLAVPVRLYDYPSLKRRFGPVLEGRWRNEESLHITLAFLAQRDPETVIRALESFEWKLNPGSLIGWDYFAQSRVLVATASDPSYQKLYDNLAETLGLPPAIVHPHVTLMRVKTIRDHDTFSLLLRKPPDAPIGEAENRIVLYRSILVPEGAHYVPIKEWPRVITL